VVATALRFRRLPIALALLTAAACATTAQLGSGGSFAEAVELYRLSDGKKAMALAVDDQGRRAWGVLYGSLGQDEANQRALESCRENAERARVRAPCHLFAIGDAQAPETVRACAEGRLSAPYCAAQSRFGW